MYWSEIMMASLLITTIFGILSIFIQKAHKIFLALIGVTLLFMLGLVLSWF